MVAKDISGLKFSSRQLPKNYPETGLAKTNIAVNSCYYSGVRSLYEEKNTINKNNTTTITIQIR